MKADWVAAVSLRRVLMVVSAIAVMVVLVMCARLLGELSAVEGALAVR